MVYEVWAFPSLWSNCPACWEYQPVPGGFAGIWSPPNRGGSPSGDSRPSRCHEVPESQLAEPTHPTELGGDTKWFCLKPVGLGTFCYAATESRDKLLPSDRRDLDSCFL